MDKEQEQRKHERRTGEEHTGQAKKWPRKAFKTRTQHLKEHTATGNQSSDCREQGQDSEGRTLQFSGLIKHKTRTNDAEHTLPKPGPATILPDPQRACTTPDSRRTIQLDMQTSSLLESKHPLCQLVDIYKRKHCP